MNAYGITHRGAVRAENQDCFRLSFCGSERLLAAVLCDGMGGARCGATASALAADAFMSHAANSLDESSRPADMKGILTEAVGYANAQVYERSFRELSCIGMGTTMVARLVSGRRAMLANVGDSRAYLLSRDRLRQVTRDHSLVEELISSGKITREEGRVHPQKNIITRAVGTEASIRADLYELKLTPDSRLLLCSDGLSNALTDETLQRVLREEPEPEQAARKLLDLALEAGATDNVTILIAQLGTEGKHG